MSDESSEAIDLATYRKVLLVVYVLHQRGFQRLRICPGMSASGMHWRCSITPVTNVEKENGARLIACLRDLRQRPHAEMLRSCGPRMYVEEKIPRGKYD